MSVVHVLFTRANANRRVGVVHLASGIGSFRLIERSIFGSWACRECLSRDTESTCMRLQVIRKSEQIDYFEEPRITGML